MAIRAVSARPIRPDVHARFLRVLARAEARAQQQHMVWQRDAGTDAALAAALDRLRLRPRPRRRRPVGQVFWTPGRRQRLERLWAKGWDYRALTRAFGHPVNGSVLWYLRERYGLRLPRRVRRNA